MKMKTVYFRYAAELVLSRKTSVEKIKEKARFARVLVSQEKLVPGHVITLGKTNRQDWLIDSLELLPGDFPQFGDWPVAPLPRP